MDRLTKKLCQTTVYVGEERKHLIPAELSVGQTREVLQKLCEYEETGLSPDEVVKLKKSAENFIAVKSGQLSPKRTSKNTKSVVKKQNKSLKISLVTMYIHHTGQTLSQ